MESKYYTPKISEFHVGFEYQILKGYENRSKMGGVIEMANVFRNSVFKQDKLGLHVDDFNFVISREMVRVKYLDREDIESLGFELDQCTKDGCVFYSGNLMSKDEWSLTFGGRRNPENYLNVKNMKGFKWGFEGTVKNKSELKKVLKMIGYER